MKKVTFIRHAQSLFNSGEKTNDLTNCPLSRTGVESCKILDQRFDLLIISPLLRAIQTYANSNIKVGRVIISPLFREVKTWELNMLDIERSDYETNEQIIERTKCAIQFLKEQPEINIGVITHHDFLHLLIKEQFGSSIYFSNLQSVTFNLIETRD